jgi:LuxR family maltose regulon positive regulatory protein
VVVERLEAPLLKAANVDQLAVVDAFRVRLALLRGDVGPAQRFLRPSVQVEPNWLSMLVEAPLMTRLWARVCLSPSTPSVSRSATAAADELVDVANEAARLHVIKRQVEALVLRALALELADHESEALESLGRAVDLAEPGSMLRTFTDMGARLALLLDRLAVRRPLSAYLQQLVMICGAAQGSVRPDAGIASSSVLAPARPSGLLDELTDREFEVLQRLARRLSNKEIGAELYISELTVKRHAANLYGKLGATSRRQAVRRAISLGLLPSG